VDEGKLPEGGTVERDASDASSMEDGGTGIPAEAGATISLTVFDNYGTFSVQYEDAFGVLRQASCDNISTNGHLPLPDCTIEVLAGSTLQFDAAPAYCPNGDLGLISFTLADGSFAPGLQSVGLICLSVAPNAVHCSLPIGQVVNVDIRWAMPSLRNALCSGPPSSLVP
jgi:hypothetical protein